MAKALRFNDMLRIAIVQYSRVHVFQNLCSNCNYFHQYIVTRTDGVNAGIGGGRIPYDVNTALVPAALRSISALARAGVYANHSDWGSLADQYAQIWEDETLQFFEVTVPAADAQARLGIYVQRNSFAGPSQTSSIDDDVVFHAISLDGYNNLSQVQVMNSDDGFRHFFLNTTNQTQLTRYINQTANNIRRTFPAGLLTSVGMLVANPAYGIQPEYAANFTNSAYHGTVVWSWQLAMMARGMELQLDRCNSQAVPDFCGDQAVHSNVLTAYKDLWDVIDKNRANLANEVWSWIYRDGDFQFTPLGSLPPPPGTGSTGVLRLKLSIIHPLTVDRIGHSPAVVPYLLGGD